MTPWARASGAVTVVVGESDPPRNRERLAVARPSTRPGLVREIILLVTLFVGYRLGRLAIAGHDDLAIANAWHVWDVERLMHLPDEETLQDWVLQWPDVLKARQLVLRDRALPGDAGVPGLGLAAPAAGGVPLGPPPDHHPHRVRDGAAHRDAARAAADAVQPGLPRHHGRRSVPSAYDGGAATVANQFAAMPSLHVGWALLIAVVVIRTARSRWRWVIVAHPVLTTLVVVVRPTTTGSTRWSRCCCSAWSCWSHPGRTRCRRRGCWLRLTGVRPSSRRLLRRGLTRNTGLAGRVVRAGRTARP